MIDKIKLAAKIKTFLDGIPTASSIEDMCYYEEHNGEVQDIDEDHEYNPLLGIKTEIPMLRGLFVKLLHELDVIETIITNE
jgi:hypothetical protein